MSYHLVDLPRVVREWEHAGLGCMVLRTPDMPCPIGTFEGWHCGYVRLPEGHGLPGRYEDAPDPIQGAAWGGELTFSGMPWGAREGLWYGFDMGHAYDFEDEPMRPFGRYLHADADAIAATERLADAIAAHLGAAS